MRRTRQGRPSARDTWDFAKTVGGGVIRERPSGGDGGRGAGGLDLESPVGAFEGFAQGHREATTGHKDDLRSGELSKEVARGVGRSLGPKVLEWLSVSVE